MAEDNLGSFAWSIISDAHNQVHEQLRDETHLHTEITRLIALNSVLSIRFSPEELGLKDNEVHLQNLSFEGASHNVSKNQVHSLVESTAFALSPESENRILGLELMDFTNLLGWIHSLGSYRLPVSLNHGTFQRSLGAYYTPPDVADYIVKITLNEVLERKLQAIRKEGFCPFEEFVNLNVLDPACGAGVFLLSSLNLLQSYRIRAINAAREAGVLQSTIDDVLSTSKPSLYGVDLDSGALEVARISLKLLNSQYPSHIDSKLKKGNSLISMNGFHGESDHHHFFENPSSINAFEWKSEFPEIFRDSNDGFDFVVMNPPYERLKPNLAEFLRERLASGRRRIHTDAYESRKQSISEFTDYVRESKEYHFATSYSLNTYQLFIERALQLTQIGGYIGCIIPSNLLGDVSAQRLRTTLIQYNKLQTIDDFPETSKMFPGVTQSVSIISIQKGGQTDNIHAGFNRLSVDDAIRRKRLKLGKDRIIKTMGSTLTIPRIPLSGFKILDLLHENPTLGSLGNIAIRRGELDLTNNKNAITQAETTTALVRGSHISRFSLIESKHKSEFVNMDVFAKTLKTSSRADHLKVERIACQQVSNMGQRWRLKFARVASGTVLANSCNYLVAKEINSVLLDYYLGILNSELINWRFQISNFNNHVSIRELQNLPIVKFDKRNKIASNLSNSVRLLDLVNIEASVFHLYRFSKNQVKSILDFRKTPDAEKECILERFSQMIY